MNRSRQDDDDYRAGGYAPFGRQLEGGPAPLSRLNGFGTLRARATARKHVIVPGAAGRDLRRPQTP